MQQIFRTIQQRLSPTVALSTANQIIQAFMFPNFRITKEVVRNPFRRFYDRVSLALAKVHPVYAHCHVLRLLKSIAIISCASVYQV